MLKYDLAKLFGDVDDKFIENAKPEAQKPIMIKAVKRSPMRIIAAASCAAVLLTGGAVAASVLHSRGITARKGANEANSSVSDVKTGNWFDEEQIYYEGEYYKVPSVLHEHYKDDCEDSERIEVTALAGLKKISAYKVEMVTVLKNNYSKPIGIKAYDRDFVAEMGFCQPGHSIPANSTGDMPVNVILQPGEVCYQKAVFDVGNGNDYTGYVSYAFERVSAVQQHKNDIVCTRSFRVLFTEDGFIDRYEGAGESPEKIDDKELDLTTDLDGDGIPDALKEANPEITDEQWELYKKMEHPEEYGLIPDGTSVSYDGRIVTHYYHEPIEQTEA